MSKLTKIGYELKDVAVIQAPISYLNHRADPDPMTVICDRKVYPIFVSPMASVTDQNNYQTWIDNGLTPIVPRSVQVSDENINGITFEERMKIAEVTFVSISLAEVSELLEYSIPTNVSKLYICIDIAHGTMSSLYDACDNIFSEFGDKVEIMTGNTATPLAYREYVDHHISWMRVGIGTGSRCTTSCNVAVHYPSATLIDELSEERKIYAKSHNGYAPTKIVIDGGINNFDDIQKAICLGCDAVMTGNVFAHCEEACGEILWAKNIQDVIDGEYFPNKIYEFIPNNYKKELKPFREYYGMSTRRAQKETGGNGDRTSEGISRPVPVEYPVAKWVDNMQSFLRSCMTYANCHDLFEMRKNSQMIILGGSGDASYRK